MTLLALTLSVGFVVDDAIVMLENIVRHIEGGMRPFEAALKGSREIGFTIVSITFSLIAVFIPVLLMGGIVGRVFREFAVTIAVAIVLSGFVSLTLDADAVRPRAAQPPRGRRRRSSSSCCAGSSACSRRGSTRYEWALDQALKFKPIVLMVTFATLAATVWLYLAIPKGFFPQEDTGFMFAITEALSDTSFDAMVERQRKIADIIRKGPGGGLHQFDGRRRRSELLAEHRAHPRGAQAEKGTRTGERGAGARCAARPATSSAWPCFSR